jgi:hypothetical protein
VRCFVCFLDYLEGEGRENEERSEGDLWERYGSRRKSENFQVID